jgi:Leucine-rich repeat (LRR) protein
MIIRTLLLISAAFFYLIGYSQDNYDLETIYTSLEKAKDNPEDVSILHIQRAAEIINPNDLMIFKNLIGLEISAKIDLDTFPGVLRDLQKLQWISIINNDIKAVTSDISAFKDIESLDLSNNQISELPDLQNVSSSITYIRLENNNLKEIPEGIDKLENLIRLTFANNQISTIPNDIVDLKLLDSFSIANNQINQLPDSIGRLSNSLKFFSVYGNSFKPEYWQWIKKQLPDTKVYVHEKDGCVMSYHDLGIYFQGDSTEMKVYLDDKHKKFGGDEK